MSSEMNNIMDKWKNYNHFEILCEQYDRKMITGQRLLEEWERNFLIEAKIIAEVFEKAWETIKTYARKGKELAGRALEAVKAAWKRVNGWVLSASIQVFELGRRAVLGAIRTARKVIDAITGWCEDHPIFCKIIIMTLLVIVITLIMSAFFDNEAQARLAVGKKPMDQKYVDMMKGEAYELMKHSKHKGVDSERYIRIMARIDDLQNAKEIHDITKMKTGLDGRMNWLYDGLKEVYQGKGFAEGLPEDERMSMLTRWQEIGSRVRAHWSEITVKTPLGSSRAIQATVKLAPKVAGK